MRLGWAHRAGRAEAAAPERGRDPVHGPAGRRSRRCSHRYTGQRTCRGVADRRPQRAEIEGLIGFFVNTLVAADGPVRGPDASGSCSAGCGRASLGAYAHQDLPFEKLVEELQPEREPRATTRCSRSCSPCRTPRAQTARAAGPQLVRAARARWRRTRSSTSTCPRGGERRGLVASRRATTRTCSRARRSSGCWGTTSGAGGGGGAAGGAGVGAVALGGGGEAAGGGGVERDGGGVPAGGEHRGGVRGAGASAGRRRWRWCSGRSG